ncbi:phospholipid scramblase 1-like [Lithobates pipiens]
MTEPPRPPDPPHPGEPPDPDEISYVQDNQQCIDVHIEGDGQCTPTILKIFWRACQVHVDIIPGVPIAPPGLENLLQVNGLSVKETRNSIFQSHCTYDLFDTNGHFVYHAAEQRECCGPQIDCRVTNAQGYNVLNLLVPSECCTCDTKLQVSTSSGELLGYIIKKWTSFTLSFDILDPLRRVCFKVKGPGWGEGFMSDLHYKVLSTDKATQIGVITRVWRGFSSKENYTINFPMDLHVPMKAMLMACTLFIKLLIEERRRQEQSRAANRH